MDYMHLKEVGILCLASIFTALAYQHNVTQYTLYLPPGSTVSLDCDIGTATHVDWYDVPQPDDFAAITLRASLISAIRSYYYSVGENPSKHRKHWYSNSSHDQDVAANGTLTLRNITQIYDNRYFICIADAIVTEVKIMVNESAEMPTISPVSLIVMTSIIYDSSVNLSTMQSIPHASNNADITKPNRPVDDVSIANINRLHLILIIAGTVCATVIFFSLTIIVVRVCQRTEKTETNRNVAEKEDHTYEYIDGFTKYDSSQIHITPNQRDQTTSGYYKLRPGSIPNYEQLASGNKSSSSNSISCQ